MMDRSRPDYRLMSSVLIWALMATSSIGQEHPPFKYEGSTSCKGCHSNPTPSFPTDFVRLTEAATWQKDDKHFMAVRLLFGVVREKDGRIRIAPESQEGALGLKMLSRLKVLSQEGLDSALARATDQDPALQTAQDKARAARERYFRALLEGADVDTLYQEFQDAETSVKEAEQAYLQPLIDTCLKSPVGRGCLACHAGLPQEKLAPETETTFRQESIHDGVSCEACHGPSSQWREPHDEPVWRTKSPTEKAKLGLNDLRHPATRANQCYSCHIGDASQGKFIEHRWFIAGHPPLPSIELETFAREMSRHWRYLAEKKNFKKNRDEFVAAIKNDPERAFEIDTKFPRTKEVLVGGVVALQKSVMLLAEVHSKDAKLAIPDFAAFDCLACHQELGTRPVVTRDEEKFDPFIPGRPNIPRWSFALADMAVDVVGKDHPELRKQFDDKIEAWRDMLTRQPFGDRDKVKPVADDLSAFLKDLEMRLAKSETTAEISSNASTRLLSIAKSELLDFHSARQIVWAAQVISEEAGQPLPMDLAYPRGDAEPSEVARYLQIQLPSGSTRPIVGEGHLKELLMRVNAYDPEHFRSLMQDALK